MYREREAMLRRAIWSRNLFVLMSVYCLISLVGSGSDKEMLISAVSLAASVVFALRFHKMYCEVLNWKESEETEEILKMNFLPDLLRWIPLDRIGRNWGRE